MLLPLKVPKVSILAIGIGRLGYENRLILIRQKNMVLSMGSESDEGSSKNPVSSLRKTRLMVYKKMVINS